MTKHLLALAVLGTAGLALGTNFTTAQNPPGFPADVGPGEQGATLKQPWLNSSGPPTAPAPRPPAANTGAGRPAPSYIQGLLHKAGVTLPAARAERTYSLRPVNSDLNKDLEVTKELGPWMICVSSYSGPEGPQMAREMAMELRNAYKLPAHVFNYGAEEKRKELERVRAIVDKQKEFLRKNKLPVDQPIRVRHLHVEEHSGVLIGGYRDDDDARRALDQLRKLPPPDPTKVKLEKKLFYTPDPNDANKAQDGEVVYANPFQRAFMVRNPAAAQKTDRPAGWDQFDLDALRRMNSEESFSLLRCKKSFTLVVKQYSVPTVVHAENNPSGGLLQKIGFGKNEDVRVDAAAKSAHNLAETFRKARLEAYVLHTKFYSLVTIGGFDGVDDPNLRAMQNLIETRMQQTIVAAGLFPKPMPMPVPR